MKTVLDLRVMDGDWSGIAQYALNLLRGLSALPKKHEWVLLFRKPSSLDKISVLPVISRDLFQIRFLDRDIYHFSNLFLLRRLLAAEKADWYFTPQFFWPYGMLPVKVACTIHDIIPLTHPHWLPRSRKASLRWVLRALTSLSLRCSNLVCVDSQATLDGLSAVFGRNATKNCRKLYPAIAPIPVPPLPNLPWDLSPEYLLYVGRQDPYKNLLRLIQAFHGLKKQGYPGKLVIAGKTDLRYPEPRELAKTLNLENDVRFTDFVDNATLASLYTHCRLVVQPSLVEGFGLTAVEPFLYRKLCVASLAPSLPEVLGDAALYFDPENMEEMQSVLWKALRMEEPEKEKLWRAGEERLKCFDPKLIAEEWIHLLESGMS